MNKSIKNRKVKFPAVENSEALLIISARCKNSCKTNAVSALTEFNE